MGVNGRDFKNVVEEVRAHSDIVQVISSYLPLKRSGQTFKACCPFHKEKTPSFHVNPQRQIFHCFGCHAGGDVFRFVMEHEKTDFITALKILADRAGVSADFQAGDPGKQADKKRMYELHELAAHFFQNCLLNQPEGAVGRDYVQQRGLAEPTVKAFLIGFAPDAWDSLLRRAQEKGFTEDDLEAAGLAIRSEKSGHCYDRFRNRLMFSIFDETGRVIGFSGRAVAQADQGAKYVNSPETLLFHKSRVLFALDKARRAMADTRTAVIVEGQIDAIRCHEAGVCNTVASQGTALTPDHARILRRYADEVVLVLDADAAGENAALKSMDAFVEQELGVRVCTLPPGEDPDTLIQKEGAEAFRDRIGNAPSAMQFKTAILSQRDDLSTEAGLMRAVRSVEETLAQVPSAVLREKMAGEAAEKLGISPQALLRDLRQHTRRPARTGPLETEPGAVTTTPDYPAEEAELLELLIHHHAAFLPFIENYILPGDLQSDDCRTIFEALLRDPPETLMTTLEQASTAVQRLAARIQMSPDRYTCDENGAQAAAQAHAEGLILAFTRRRAQKAYERLCEQRRTEGPSPEIQERIFELKKLIRRTRLGWLEAQPWLTPVH